MPSSKLRSRRKRHHLQPHLQPRLCRLGRVHQAARPLLLAAALLAAPALLGGDDHKLPPSNRGAAAARDLPRRAAACAAAAAAAAVWAACWHHGAGCIDLLMTSPLMLRGLQGGRASQGAGPDLSSPATKATGLEMAAISSETNCVRFQWVDGRKGGGHGCNLASAPVHGLTHVLAQGLDAKLVIIASGDREGKQWRPASWEAAHLRLRALQRCSGSIAANCQAIKHRNRAGSHPENPALLGAALPGLVLVKPEDQALIKLMVNAHPWKRHCRQRCRAAAKRRRRRCRRWCRCPGQAPPARCVRASCRLRQALFL